MTQTPWDGAPARLPVELTTPRHHELFDQCRARWPDFQMYREEHRPERAPAATPPKWAVVATCTVDGTPREVGLIEKAGVDVVMMVLLCAVSSLNP